MPKVETRQISFNGGELDPALWSRFDTERYASGVAFLENFIPRPHGGAYKRPGTHLIDYALETTKPQRFIPFKFSTEQSYMLEFGDKRMRVIMNDALVAYPEGHAQAGQPVVVESPYAAGDLARVIFAQRNDLMVLTHANYPIYTLKRVGNHHTWVFEAAKFVDVDNMPIAAPAGLRLTKDGMNGAAYCVAAINSTNSESLTSNIVSAGRVSGEAAMPEPVGGWDAMMIEDLYDYSQTWGLMHLWPDRDNPYYPREHPNEEWTPPDGFAYWFLNYQNYPYMTGEGNGTRIDFRRPDGSGGEVVKAGYDWRGEMIYAVDMDWGGSLTRMRKVIGDYVTSHNNLAVATNHSTLAWNTVPSARYYNIYRSPSAAGPFLFIGTTTQTMFDDTNLPYNAARGPVITDNPFSGPNQKPGVCMFVEQRLLLARSNEKPQRFWGSRTGGGSYFDFSKHSPIQDDDAYEFDLDSRDANEILWGAMLGEILFGTSSGEWKVGGGNEAITPTNINAREQSAWGCSTVHPVIVGRSIVFVGRSGKVVRDMAYSLDADGFDGDDLTIYAQHLFANRTIREIAYQQEPSSVLWLVMSDGALLSCTYLPKQKVIAWSRHRTPGGRYENIGSLVNTDGTDRIYFIVSRTVNGVTRKMVEVMKDSMLPGDALAEMHYLDSSLTYRGEGEKATGLAGLDHLEGRTVDVLADGNHLRRVVKNGCIELDYPARIIHAGLGYRAVLETLDMHPPQQPVVARPHSLVSAELHLEKSVSCLAGPIDGEGDEVIRPEDEAGPALRGGKFLIHLEKPREDTPASGFRMRIESGTPYPLCVLAINAVGEAGGQ